MSCGQSKSSPETHLQITFNGPANVSIRIKELSNGKSLGLGNVIQKTVNSAHPVFDFFQAALSIPLPGQGQTWIEPGDILFSIAGKRPFQALPGMWKSTGKILGLSNADLVPGAPGCRAP